MSLLRRVVLVSLLACAQAIAADPEPEAAKVPAAPVEEKPAIAAPAKESEARPDEGQSRERASRGEALTFYAAGGVYGLTTGIWINSLFGLTNPGVAALFPLTLTAAGVVGAYSVDSTLAPRRGVLAATTLGLGLGAANGAGIAAAQSTASDKSRSWNYATQGSLAFVLMTGGAVGGYAYGEYVRPDARGVAFVGNGAAWGAITGVFLGAGGTSGPWEAGASLWGTIAMNAGAATTAIAAAIGGAPSFKTQRYMWLGYGAGTAASSAVYLSYLFSSEDPRVGLVTNAIGGLAGLAVGAAFGAGLTDDAEATAGLLDGSHLSFSPVPGGGVARRSGAL